MKSQWTILVLFLLVAAAQVYAPISMILEREKILREGDPFKFNTAPVDPFDPFHGRYVWLNFEENTAEIDPDDKWEYGTKGFARIVVGEEGFAKFSKVTHERPSEGPFLEVETYGPESDKTIRVAIPYERYYMRETDAPQAEIAYREHNRRNERDAYAVIRVLDGKGVLESLFVAGQPIEEFIKTPPEEENEMETTVVPSID